MRLDESPSDEDIDRFGDDAKQTGFCPECGKEVWDDAPQCPACGGWIEGRVLRKPLIATEFHRRMMMLIAILILAAFFFVFVL